MLNTADRRFLLAAPLAIIAGCSLFNLSCISNRLPAPPGDPVIRTLEVTGYCNCGKCCSWERSWWGFGPPVYTAGKMKGKRKEIGVTASGSKATRGTIAADVTRYPMGTVMFVPGYGWGRVEDRGGAIVGEKIDLWFPTHQEAKNWGRQKIPTKIWLPPKKTPPKK